MPRVTVLMAVYNGERYLREAIDSILAQSFKDFEFLIVDDGSSDRSRALIRASADPRIRLIENGANLGLPQSLNRGLALARGELIARQDADDISHPERLAAQVAFLERHPAIGLLGTWYSEIDHTGKYLGARELPCDWLGIRWALLFYCPFVHSAVMFRKEVVLQAGGYDETCAYGQDYELWCRLVPRHPAANLGAQLLTLRLNPWSITNIYGDRAQQGRDRACAAVAQLLGWPVGDGAAARLRFNGMYELLYGEAYGLDARAAAAACTEVVRLAEVFYWHNQAGAAQAGRHRGALYARLSRQVMAAAQGQFYQNTQAETWQLCRRAWRLDWRALVERTALSFYARLLLGPRLARRAGRVLRAALSPAERAD